MAAVLGAIDHRSGAARHGLGLVAGGVATVLFLFLAATRRLNFDELLALRAGWLDIAGIEARPAFLMPWTLFLGWASHAIPDPGVLFVSLRLGSAIAVVGSFTWAARACGVGLSGAGFALLLAVLNASFGVHGLEFRYDAPILVGLLAGAALLARSGPAPALQLGAIAGLVALHHLKGAFFAAGLFALLLRVSTQRSRDVTRFGIAFVGVGASWASLVAALGLFPRWIASLEQFFSLAGGTRRAPFAETMGPTLMADFAWWLVVLTVIVRSIGRQRREAAPGGRREILLALGGLGVAFWVLHPHAWPYLAAPPVALLSLLAVAEADVRRDGLWLAGIVVVGLAIQMAKPAWRPLDFQRRSFAAPISEEVAALRRLRGALAPDDRVLDPSGIAYFVPPCTQDWYVDSLFAERIASGRWMAELAGGIPLECTLAVDTYRLRALPASAIRSLRREFLSVGGGVAVRGDRGRAGFEAPFAGAERIESFW